MPLTFTAIRLGVFAVLVGLSGVVIGLAVHYRGMISNQIIWIPPTIPLDSSYQVYPLAVGAMSIILLLPAIIIFLVRSPTTPQLWIELLVTFILAILWMVVGLRVVTLGLNNISCDYYKQMRAINVNVDNVAATCSEIKVLEFFGFAAFGLLILYILGMLVLAFKAKKNGDSPWTRETHELQEKSW